MEELGTRNIYIIPPHVTRFARVERSVAWSELSLCAYPLSMPFCSPWPVFFRSAENAASRWQPTPKSGRYATRLSSTIHEQRVRVVSFM